VPFEVAVPEGYSERFNLAPTQNALIVRERDGEREAGELPLLPGPSRASRPDDELVCPDNHVTALRQSLSQQHYSYDTG